MRKNGLRRSASTNPLVLFLFLFCFSTLNVVDSFPQRADFLRRQSFFSSDVYSVNNKKWTCHYVYQRHHHHFLQSHRRPHWNPNGDDDDDARQVEDRLFPLKSVPFNVKKMALAIGFSLLVHTLPLQFLPASTSRANAAAAPPPSPASASASATVSSISHRLMDTIFGSSGISNSAVEDALVEQDCRLALQAQQELEEMQRTAREIQITKGRSARKRFELNYKLQQQRQEQAKAQGLQELLLNLLQQGIDPKVDLEGKRQVVFYTKGIDLGDVAGTPFYLERRLERMAYPQSLACRKQYHRQIIACMVQDLQNRLGTMINVLDYFETKHRYKTTAIWQLDQEQAKALAERYSSNLKRYGQIASVKISVLNAFENIVKGTKVPATEAAKTATPQGLNLPGIFQKLTSSATTTTDAATSSAAGKQSVLPFSVRTAAAATLLVGGGYYALNVYTNNNNNDEEQQRQDLLMKDLGRFLGVIKSPLADVAALKADDSDYDGPSEDESRARAPRRSPFASTPSIDQGESAEKSYPSYATTPSTPTAAKEPDANPPMFDQWMKSHPPASAAEPIKPTADELATSTDPKMRWAKLNSKTPTSPSATSSTATTTPTPTPTTASTEAQNPTTTTSTTTTEKQPPPSDLYELVSGQDARAPGFALLVAKMLTFGAPGCFDHVLSLPGDGMPLLEKFDIFAAENELIRSRTAAALDADASMEIFEAVSKCMLNELVELEASSIQQHKDFANADAIDVVVDFMDHVSLVNDALLDGFVHSPVSNNNPKSDQEQKKRTYFGGPI